MMYVCGKHTILGKRSCLYLDSMPYSGKHTFIYPSASTGEGAASGRAGGPCGTPSALYFRGCLVLQNNLEWKVIIVFQALLGR